MSLRRSIALLALLLAGCAVQQTGPGGLQIGLDEAELLGRRLETIPLVDGSEATLRQLGRVISFKLQSSSTVIPLRDAHQARVLRTEFIGDRTLIVVEKSTGGCPQNVDVFAVRGREVSVWTFRECRLQLQIERNGDEVYLDKVAHNWLTRTIYRDDKLLRLKPVRIDAAPVSPSQPRPRWQPSDPPAIVAEGTPRHVPGLPIPAEQFKSALAGRPFLPELPAGPVVATAAKVTNPAVAQSTERQVPSRSSSDPVKRPPPPRPRSLAGEVEEDVAPVRIKLD